VFQSQAELKFSASGCCINIYQLLSIYS